MTYVSRFVSFRFQLLYGNFLCLPGTSRLFLAAAGLGNRSTGRRSGLQGGGPKPGCWRKKVVIWTKITPMQYKRFCSKAGPYLTELVLAGPNMTRIKQLGKSLRKLTLLSIQRDKTKAITEGVVRCLTRLPLRYLRLQDLGRLSGAGVAHLKELKTLRHLELRGCSRYWDETVAPEEGLAYIGKLQLETLVLDLKVTDATLMHLWELPLRKLVLTQLDVSRAGLSKLNRTTLKHLELFFTYNTIGVEDFDEAELIGLAGLNLNHLLLARVDISDRGLAHLKDMPLKYLEIGFFVHEDDHNEDPKSIEITDDGTFFLCSYFARVYFTLMCFLGLAALAGMPLQVLKLYSCQSLTGVGLAHLRHTPLKHLELIFRDLLDDGSKFSDAGLAALGQIGLEELVLGPKNMK